MRRSSRLRLQVPAARPQFDKPTYPEYEELLAAAEAAYRADGGFVNPAKIRDYDSLDRSHDWFVAVLGHGGNLSSCTTVEMHLALIADQRGINPPLPAWLTEQRAAQKAEQDAKDAAYRERQRLLNTEWDALKSALPVNVVAAYNYSGPRHEEYYQSGANHILLRADLTVGRLVRRAGDALCTTPSSARHQIFVDPGEEGGWPSCKTCLRTAARLANVQTPTLLGLENQIGSPFTAAQHRRWKRA